MLIPDIIGFLFTLRPMLSTLYNVLERLSRSMQGSFQNEWMYSFRNLSHCSVLMRVIHYSNISAGLYTLFLQQIVGLEPILVWVHRDQNRKPSKSGNSKRAMLKSCPMHDETSTLILQAKCRKKGAKPTHHLEYSFK